MIRALPPSPEKFDPENDRQARRIIAQSIEDVTRKVEGLPGLPFIVVTEHPYNAKGDGVTDDTTAFINFLAAIPDGGTGLVPAKIGSTTYLINQTLAITKSVQLTGSVTSIDNAGAHQNPTIRWTGGAAPLFTISGAGATGAKLKSIGLDNTGTGTVAVDIDNAGSVFLEGVTCVSPTVPFSSTGVRVGFTANTTDIVLRDVVFRGSAPIGLNVVQCAAQIVLDHARFLEHSSQNVLLGTATTNVLSFQANNGSTFEQLANIDSVFIQRAKLVRFDGAYFENGGTGFSINIPSTATVAEAIVVDGCMFGGLAAAGYAINSAFASGNLVALDNHYLGYSTAFIKNVATARILSIGNDIDSAIPDLDSYTNAVSLANFAAGRLGTRLLGQTVIGGGPTNVIGITLGDTGAPSWVGTINSSGAICLAYNAVPTPAVDSWVQQNAALASVLLRLNGASGLTGCDVFTAPAATATATFATFWGTSIFGASADSFAKMKIGNSTSSVGFYGVTPIGRALLATGAAHTVDDVITALQNLGLVRQS